MTEDHLSILYNSHEIGFKCVEIYYFAQTTSFYTIWKTWRKHILATFMRIINVWSSGECLLDFLIIIIHFFFFVPSSSVCFSPLPSLSLHPSPHTRYCRCPGNRSQLYCNKRAGFLSQEEVVTRTLTSPLHSSLKKNSPLVHHRLPWQCSWNL